MLMVFLQLGHRTCGAVELGLSWTTWPHEHLNDSQSLCFRRYCMGLPDCRVRSALDSAASTRGTAC